MVGALRVARASSVSEADEVKAPDTAMPAQLWRWLSPGLVHGTRPLTSW